ncbi:MAG: hypothetical protein OJF62_002666 [Pseudolabrys sp.]|nr:hypothetical protein [Pseudolabrys sp.]
MHGFVRPPVGYWPGLSPRSDRLKSARQPVPPRRDPGRSKAAMSWTQVGFSAIAARLKSLI